MAQAHHNLEPDDLLRAVDVINTIFLTEVHVKNGYLLVFDAWRQKKARRDPDAAKRPPEAYVRNESPSAAP